MAEKTKIQWCDATFNAWWGCVEDGPECDNCYARTFAKRTGHNVWGLGDRRFFGDLHWKEPLLWNAKAEKAGRRARVFCGSMMDIGERRNDAVGERMDGERCKLWALIERTPWLDWLLLTKRPQNMPRLLPLEWATHGTPDNVWIGTTAGNRDGWDKRVKFLRQLDPAVRFVSVEPQLGGLGTVGLDGIHWVIQGGESGGGARPFDVAWARSLKEQCRNASVAYFLKQLGANVRDRNDAGFDGQDGDAWDVAGDYDRVEHDVDGYREEYQGAPVRVRLNDRKGGDESEWPADLRGCREFPRPA